MWQARSLPDGEWIVWRGGSIATHGHAESTEDGVTRCEEAIQALTVTVEPERGAGSALEMLRAKWRAQKRRQKDRRDETERNSADL
jgi:hypothetical protein